LPFPFIFVLGSFMPLSFLQDKVDVKELSQYLTVIYLS